MLSVVMLSDVAPIDDVYVLPMASIHKPRDFQKRLNISTFGNLPIYQENLVSTTTRESTSL
jgi:hypothetical protein